MEDYQSGGTSWFTIINPEGHVFFAGLRLDAGRFLQVLGAESADLSQS